MRLAIIVSCADGRLRELLLALETRLDLGEAHRLLVPGGPLTIVRDATERATVLRWLDLLVGDHVSQLICLVSHEDCLAYVDRVRRDGGGERGVLERDLHVAHGIVAQRYPSLVVEAYIVPRDPGARGRLGAPERLSL